MIGKTVNWVVGRFTRILGSVTGTIKKTDLELSLRELKMTKNK